MSQSRKSGEPVPLGDSVAAVGRELGIPAPDAFATITDAWPEIVGDALVAHSQVRSIRDGVCTIAVDGPGWATQLRYAERQVVEREEPGRALQREDRRERRILRHPLTRKQG